MSAEALQAEESAEQKSISDRFFHSKAGGETVAGIRGELTHTMETGDGIYRNESSLRETCGVIRDLKRRYPNVTIADTSLSFNTELTTALELENMLDVAETVANSALQRTESRGSHQRVDHPDRDDGKFLKHSLAYLTDAEPRVEYKDVVITRWPPKERVYGRT